MTRYHYTANHFEASSQATILNIIGKAPRNYIEEKRQKKNNKLFTYYTNRYRLPCNFAWKIIDVFQDIVLKLRRSVLEQTYRLRR